MNSNIKRMTIVLFGLLISISGFAAEKWNLLIGNWQDLSPKKDANLSYIVRRSLVSSLEDNSNYNILPFSDMNRFVDTYTDIVNLGVENKADAVITGDIYVENNKVIVVAELFDVLQNRYRFRKFYTNVITLDLFDTIDAITGDLIKAIRESLPTISMQDEVEIKRIRKVKYESQAVAMNRFFYTHLGLQFVYSPLNGLYIIEDGPSKLKTNYNRVDISCIEYNFGVTARFEDFRVDFALLELPGFFVYDLNNNKISSAFPMFVEVLGFYYLPFWDKKFAVGTGFSFAHHYFGYEYENSQTSTNLASFNIFNWLNIAGIWTPTPNLELGFIWRLPILLNQATNAYDLNQPQNTQWTSYQIEFPALQLNAIYFFNDYLGIEAQVYAESVYLQRGEYKTNGSINDNKLYVAYNQMFRFYLGGVYRVDFFKKTE